MADIKKQLIDITSKIWGFREKQAIWYDIEYEKPTPENLVYKRLDGLRAILLPISHGKLTLDECALSKDEFIDEVRLLAIYLSNPGQHFYPAPHPFSVNPQPDDYIDMASHSLLFALAALRIANSIEDKAILRKLISKCITCLTQKDHFFIDNKLKKVAWAGTTLHEPTAHGLDPKSVYFTSQAVLALGDWLKDPIGLGPKVSKNKIDAVKDLVRNACRWILSQKSDTGAYLVINKNEDAGQNLSDDQIITINASALRACIEQKKYLASTEQQHTREICEKFIEFLKLHKPKKLKWNHQVLTSKLSYQHYPDRQDNYGIVTFLGRASEFLSEAWAQTIEELAEYFIQTYIEGVIVEDLYIGSLPFYMEDVIAANKQFTGVFETLTFTKKTIRSAITKTFADVSLQERMGKTIVKYMAEMSEKEIKKTQPKKVKKRRRKGKKQR
jgi:hypothetical protein